MTVKLLPSPGLVVVPVVKSMPGVLCRKMSRSSQLLRPMFCVSPIAEFEFEVGVLGGLSKLDEVPWSRSRQRPHVVDEIEVCDVRPHLDRPDVVVAVPVDVRHLEVEHPRRCVPCGDRERRVSTSCRAPVVLEDRDVPQSIRDDRTGSRVRPEGEHFAGRPRNHPHCHR